MPQRALHRTAVAFAGLLVVIALLLTGVCRADTVATLLGNFTINQYCGLTLAPDTIDVHYVIVFGQLPALRELHLADADGNGVTSQEERDAYVRTLAPGIAQALTLRVNGLRVPLHAVRWMSSLPTEQGGFSLRVDVDFTGSLPAVAMDAPALLEFDNENYAGRLGWHEIVVEAASGMSLFNSNAYRTSLTNGLVDALQALPAEGPLDERAVHVSFVSGPRPPSAQPLAARINGTATTAAPPADARRNTGGSDTAWLTQRTRQLVDAISGPRVAPRVLLLALLGALLLGGVHALSPGHGKTIVGAYLIGSRGTPRHAAFLGVTVTITHTLGVFALGFATLYASRFIVPEILFPILSLFSSLLIFGMGVVLLVHRGRIARGALSQASLGIFQAVSTRDSSLGESRGYIFSPTAPALDPTMHSHGGGPLHSHLPPGGKGEKVTWKSLLALGISGGLVPCPSALVLLLAAVALNKTAYGMLLVLAFSVGLAITLTTVGLAFLYARNRFSRRGTGSRWFHVLPVLSALTITTLGIVLCFSALKALS